MQKLIKISEQHYIIVDDSEIKEGDFVYDSKDKVIRYVKKYLKDNWCKKITHSFGKELKGVENRPLSEVEELIYEYNVEELNTCKGSDFRVEWENGFNAHKELVKDKLFTVEDMRNAVQMAWEADSIDGTVDLNIVLHYGNNNDLRTKWSEEEIIQSLLPPTEWKVKFNEQGKLELCKS